RFGSKFDSVDVCDREVKVPDVGELQTIQDFYDRTFPGNSTIETFFDGYEVATGGIQIEVDNCKIFPHKNVKVWQEKRGLIPALRTAMPEKRQNGLVESLLALKKRNMAAPKLQEAVNEFEIIGETIEKAKAVFFNETLIDNTECSTLEANMRWWEKQSHTARQQMLADTRFVDQIDLCTYNFMIKNDVKPKMDLTPQSEYAALQTVVYPDKIVNALFGPVMKEINERIRYALKPHVVYNSRMNADELDRTVEFLDVNKKYNAFEIDFSKFDKSKTSLHIRAVIELYKLFGLEELLAFMWEKSQCQTVVKDRLNGIVAYLLYQQKSGNCDTYGSNTWSAALALLETMPLEKAEFMIFGGDDSLILFPEEVVVEDPCRRLASLWNFDCKLFSFNHNLFCGKFLLKIGDRYRFSPDPVKLMTKLGRKDIVDGQVLSEIFVSIGDNYKSYRDFRILSALAAAVQERYRTNEDALAALISLRKYISDFSLFSSMFGYKGGFVESKVSKDYEW
ncbi:59-kDa readthrough protein, partial [Sorghum chlorotic spot virus]